MIGRPDAAIDGARDRCVEPSAGDDDLARPEHRELVGERLHAVRAGVLGGRELAGGEIEQRDAERSPSGAPGATAIRNAGSRASR